MAAALSLAASFSVIAGPMSGARQIQLGMVEPIETTLGRRQLRLVLAQLS